MTIDHPDRPISEIMTDYDILRMRRIKCRLNELQALSEDKDAIMTMSDYAEAAHLAHDAEYFANKTRACNLAQQEDENDGD